MDVQYYLSDNEIDWVAGGLRADGIIEYNEGIEYRRTPPYGYALTAENRLAPEQRQVLQAMWGAQKALSVRQLRSATRLSSACIRGIIEELQVIPV